MKWIFIGVDGSDSYTWRPQHKGYSHVNDFYKNFKPKGYVKKTYYDGPSWNGKESKNIYIRSMNFIFKSIGQMKIPTPSFVSSTGKGDYGIRQNDLRIVLVGHSRGGAIVACVAKILYEKYKIKTYFIGLYDAVDRCSLHPPNNLDYYATHVYHGVRSPKARSRIEFGNCCEGVKFKKEFITSHGGMGGALVQNAGVIGDSSQDPNSFYGQYMSMQGTNIWERAKRESGNVHRWILRNAKSCDVNV